MEKPFTEMAVYVSPSGHDCADGTSTQPVATLHRAAEIARRCPKGRADRVTVHVATGKYFFSEPLFLTEADSDTAWIADGEVILTGAMPLDDLNWSDFADNPAIQVADVAKDLVIDQLFVDGKQQILARYPNYDASQPLQGSATQADIKARSVGWKDPVDIFEHCTATNGVAIRIGFSARRIMGSG